MNQKLLDDINEKLKAVMAQSPAADLERNLRAMLGAAFAKLDLVSREEFDIQREVLARTRARLAELEKQIAALEADDLAAMGTSAFKAMLALFGKGKEQDEDGNEFEVVFYESYAAMGTRCRHGGAEAVPRHRPGPVPGVSRRPVASLPTAWLEVRVYRAYLSTRHCSHCGCGWHHHANRKKLEDCVPHGAVRECSLFECSGVVALPQARGLSPHRYHAA